MIKELILVGIGGFFGSVARYLISTLMIGISTSALPLGTFLVNIVGSLLIGVMIAVINGGNWYYLCVIGFCGGFTTFSSFSAEIMQMIRAGHWATAAGYISLSVVVCIIAVGMGLFIGEKFNVKI